MPYTTEFIDGGRGVVHVGTGVVLGAEILAGAVADHESPERAPEITHGLVDLGQVSELKISIQELRLIATENRVTAKIAPRCVVAVIAPGDHMFGMARVWEAFAADTGWTIRVFRDRPTAEAWLRETLSQNAPPRVRRER